MKIREKDDRIKALTNQAAVREQKYRARFREEGAVGLDVRNWADRNSDKLRGPVVGPVGLEVSGRGGEGEGSYITTTELHFSC